MRKKMVGYLISAAFMVVFICSASIALELNVESKTVRQGETFTLQVMLSNADTLGNVTFDIAYPPDKLELLNISPATVANLQNALYAVNPETFPSDADRVRFSWVLGAGYTGDGNIITLQFKIGAVEDREIPVTVESLSAVKASEALEDQDAVGHSGVLTVKFYGDVTDNGLITAYDASKILLHVVGREKLPDEVLPLADVSGRNGVNPYDAALVLMKVVGKIRVFPVLGGQGAPPAFLTPRVLKVADGKVEGGKVKVPVEIDDAGGVISGDISLRFDPNMLRFVKVETTDLTEGYLVEQTCDAGKLRVVFAGSEAMPSGKGKMLQLEFELIGENRDGTEIEIERAKLNEGVRLELHGGRVDLVPNRTALLPNYPNPFNPETWIPFQLSIGTKVEIEIYDINGHLVRRLDLGFKRAGYYTSRSRAAYWDGRNELGERVASGIYIYRMKAAGKSLTRRLVVLK
ncbi:T9SS type A sorting domain-containing protein [Candidatus Poribacteria bacterium]|nr:T9SS type A sorting domain-containing protein [Candidatus Poribacteria bacterium]